MSFHQRYSNLMSGIQSFKKGALLRNVVKRVLMGPAAMFTAQKIADELALDPSLAPWAVLLERTNPIDMEHFLEGILPNADVSPLVGYCTPGKADNLTAAAAWVDRKVLDFGSEDTKAVCCYLH